MKELIELQEMRDKNEISEDDFGMEIRRIVAEQRAIERSKPSIYREAAKQALKHGVKQIKLPELPKQGKDELTDDYHERLHTL